jgi:hypothetical protein
MNLPPARRCGRARATLVIGALARKRKLGGESCEIVSRSRLQIGFVA